jgi:hypothetical protein
MVESQSVTQDYIHIDEALKLATARTCEEIASLLDKGESAKAAASPKKAPDLGRRHSLDPT